MVREYDRIGSPEPSCQPPSCVRHAATTDPPVGIRRRWLHPSATRIPCEQDLRQLCRSDFDGLFGQAPFEHAVGEADGSPAVGGEEPHRFVSEHAVGATAVGNDLGIGG